MQGTGSNLKVHRVCRFKVLNRVGGTEKVVGFGVLGSLCDVCDLSLVECRVAEGTEF